MASPPAFPVAHGNVYVRGFPQEWGESQLIALFAAHGSIASIRCVAGGEQSIGGSGGSAAAAHAFCKFEQAEQVILLQIQAAEAIQALNGTTIDGCQLVVKFADADVQPRVESGRQPSEWCYCRNLPANYTRQDVGEMFVPFGTVLEIRLFPSTELYKGSGALVQMQSVDQAAVAIQTLNGSFPRGATQPLLVRYADSPAEKAAKQARKERLMQKQSTGAGMFGTNSLLAAQLQQQLLGLAINGSGRTLSMPNGTLGSPDLSNVLPPILMDSYQDGNGSLAASSGMLQQQAAAPVPVPPGTGASIYIKGMPEGADKLWLYEKFARFGGITSVRVLIDDQSGKCNGIGLVNYVTGDAALLAQELMNGASMGDRLLHVMVQNPAARSLSAPGCPAAAPPGHSMTAGVSGGLPPGPPPISAMHAAAANLGFNASTLANLQAGIMPTATGSMALPHVPNGLPLHGGYCGMGDIHGSGSFGQLQW